MNISNYETFCVNKEIGSSQTLKDVIDFFEETDDLKLIRKFVQTVQDRVYVSWASVDAKDHEGEKIPIQDIISEQETLKKRGAPITDNHSNAHVGKTLAYKVLLHPVTKTLGVLHLNQIFSDNKRDDIVWDGIITGKKIGSSVGGIKDFTRIEQDDSPSGTVRILEGFKQFETSIVEKPCNPWALNEAFSVVAKSYNGKTMKLNKMVNEEKKIETVIKQDEAQIVAPQEQANLVDIISNLTQTIKSMEDRLNEVEDVVSGKPVETTLNGETKSTDKTSDSEHDDDDEEEKKKKKKLEEEEKAKKSIEHSNSTIADIKKDLDVTRKEIQEIRKSMETVKLIESQRPGAVIKKSISVLDIARGNATRQEYQAQYNNWK